MANTGVVNKSRAEIPTIDCCLVVVRSQDGSAFGFDTSSSVAVEVQTETTDAQKLVIKNKLRAQKPEQTTITGCQITLKDNVFNPQLVLILQGGKIKYDTANPNDIVGYTPPTPGSGDTGEVFGLECYSAVYTASGQIAKYERTTFPGCQGVPIAFGAEDNTFRAPEYTINSFPSEDEPPYDIEYVKELPELVDYEDAAPGY